jgi:hypothetical protein
VVQAEPVPETLPNRPRDTSKVDGILTSDTRLAARVLSHCSASSSGSSCGVLDVSCDPPGSGVAVPSAVRAGESGLGESVSVLFLTETIGESTHSSVAETVQSKSSAE